MSYNHQRFAYFTKDSSFLEKKDQLDSNCITFREENKSIYVNGHDFGEPYDDSSVIERIDDIDNKIGDIESLIEFCLSGEDVE